MKNTPKEVYLQVGEDQEEIKDFQNLTDVTWSVDKQFDSDLEYERIDRSICDECGGKEFITMSLTGYIDKDQEPYESGKYEGLKKEHEDLDGCQIHASMLVCGNCRSMIASDFVEL